MPPDDVNEKNGYRDTMEKDATKFEREMRELKDELELEGVEAGMNSLTV